MAKFKNVSPLGALYVPALGRDVQPDEEFEVRADLASAFAGQPDNYTPVDAPAKKAAKALAADAGDDEKENGDVDAA